MAKSKRDNSRKKNLENFKQSQKTKVTSMNGEQPTTVRQVPVWNASTVIEMTGLEFQAIYEFIANAQAAQQALASVMSKNILKGKINLDFEKQDENGNFVPMSDEEKAPHAEQLKVMLEQLKASQEAKPEQEQPSVEATPESEA